MGWTGMTKIWELEYGWVGGRVCVCMCVGQVQGHFYWGKIVFLSPSFNTFSSSLLYLHFLLCPFSVLPFFGIALGA